VIGIAVAALAGAIGYAELVHDWRAERSDQVTRVVASVTYSLSLEAYNKMLADNKERYGDRAKVDMDLQTGEIQVTLDGQVVERRTETKSMTGVQGMFAMGRTKDDVGARFPFRIAFHSDLEPSRALVLFLKQRFKRAPEAWFQFDDEDWTIDRCASLSDGFGFGFVGKALLREGTACVVTWKGQQPSSMIVSVSRADGDPWLRPFARRLCRAIVSAALKRFDPDAPGSPKYAACILADRPAYVSVSKSLVADVYAVGPGNSVARLDRRPAYN
jgi:hypothetical protein